jgi:hypothetical protein
LTVAVNSGAAPAAAPADASSFHVAAGQSIREAWEAFGTRMNVRAYWAAPDLVARAAMDLPGLDIEEVGKRIVTGASMSGMVLKVQVFQNDAGQVHSIRIVPN